MQKMHLTPPVVYALLNTAIFTCIAGESANSAQKKPVVGFCEGAAPMAQPLNDTFVYLTLSSPRG